MFIAMFSLNLDPREVQAAPALKGGGRGHFPPLKFSKFEGFH